jgi:dihydroorotate dehydrogenase electron transfer subunit
VSTPERGQFDCSVVSNTVLCREHFRLILRLPRFPSTLPVQFVQIATGPQTMLRRPFSLAGRRDVAGGVELEIIHRVVGVGTAWLSRLNVGDAVSVLGPLGNAFELPRKGQTALLVGGGVGIPPMLYLATALEDREGVGFVGAVTRDLLPVTVVGEKVEEFARHGLDSVVSTDDGSFGYHGFVTQALERYLDDAAPQAKHVVYTCGPELMMKRVAAIALERGIECQVAVERAMACGLGTCQSCCIKVRKEDPSQPPLAGSEWCYRLACTEGPIFHGEDLLW